MTRTSKTKHYLCTVDKNGNLQGTLWTKYNTTCCDQPMCDSQLPRNLVYNKWLYLSWWNSFFKCPQVSSFLFFAQFHGLEWLEHS